MSIVIDASVAVEWFMPTCSGISEIALAKVVTEGAIVPALWRCEVQDVLRRLELAKRLVKSADFIRMELRELPISVDDDVRVLFGAEASVATRYNLTVYEAAYLELAIRRGSSLATNDGPLAAAAKSAKLVPLRPAL